MKQGYGGYQNVSDQNAIRNNSSQNTSVVQNLQFEDLYNFKTTFQPFQVQEIIQSFNIGDLINDQQALNDFHITNELKKKKKMSKEEKDLFKWIFIKLYEIQPFCINMIPSHIWHKISSLLNRPIDQIKEMRKYIEKRNIYSLPWSQDEDLHLFNIVSKQGESSNKIRWTYIRLKTNNKHIRLPRQCRERWMNHLSPNINRKDWTQLETIQLIDQVEQIGRKWAQIGRKLNRNDNQVKNKYKAVIQKNQLSQKQQQKKENSINSDNYVLNSNRAPDLNLEYQLGFANLCTKQVYFCDQNQFLMLLKKKESLLHEQSNLFNNEQDFFNPFHSDYNYDDELNELNDIDGCHMQG